VVSADPLRIGNQALFLGQVCKPVLAPPLQQAFEKRRERRQDKAKTDPTAESVAINEPVEEDFNPVSPSAIAFQQPADKRCVASGKNPRPDSVNAVLTLWMRFSRLFISAHPFFSGGFKYQKQIRSLSFWTG
jgi:hypothetical protein